MTKVTHTPLLCLALLLGEAAWADAEGDAIRAALESHKRSLVRVEATVLHHVERLPGLTRGTRRSHRVSVPGVVVSADGLVALPLKALDPAGDVFALLGGGQGRGDVMQVAVAGSDGRLRTAEWLGATPGEELAFVRVSAVGREGLAPVQLSDNSPQLGDPLVVLTLGPPRLGRPGTADLARVSFASDGVFGTTPRLPHALGGLVLDGSGAPLGVLATLPLLEADREGSLLRPDLLAASRAGYVLTAARLRPLIEQPPRAVRTASGRRQRAWLGVKQEPMTPELAELHGLDVDLGVRVAEVYPGGPAEKAKLQVGDVLLQFDEEPLDLDPGESFHDLVQDYPVGSQVSVRVHRAGKALEMQVELTAGPVRPELADRQSFTAVGILARDVTFYDRHELKLAAETAGVVVVELEPDGAASRAGLRPGDVLLKIGGEPVAGLLDAQERLSGAGEHPVVLRRRDEELTLRVRH